MIVVKGKGNIYELRAEVGDVRICRRVGYNRANELIEEKIPDEEIARRFFVWGKPDYVTRQTIHGATRALFRAMVEMHHRGTDTGKDALLRNAEGGTARQEQGRSFPLGGSGGLSLRNSGFTIN